MIEPENKITVNAFSLSFGEKAILKNVALGFAEKKVTALIGPSGCGKSTLLRSINRMHDFLTGVSMKGQILLGNKNIYDPDISPTELRKKIGMVFQRPNPFPKSIFENIAYGLRINNTPEPMIKELVAKSLMESYLWDEVKDELKKPAVQLSGGQQQRLCIARAVALRPEVILMDEPCSALDPLSTTKIEHLILELKKTFTVIIVTHNMQQALRVADETAFMYLGQVVESAATRQLFSNPVNQLTKNYVEGSFG